MATPIPKNEAAFTLEEVLRATRGSVTKGSASTSASASGGASTPAAPARGVVSDSRAVVPGSIFVALRGETHDGHAFVDKAVAAGAAIVVAERGRLAGPLAASVVEVDDTLVAWGDLARAHLERWRARDPGRRVVAITGSAGKTTTKELTAALLGAVAPTCFTAGNLNNRIGVPAVVFGVEDRHRYCVLEMGMSLPGELDAITSFARPDVAIVTNVGVAHAEGVGGRDGVMREKGAVYRALTEGGVAIVNADDAYATRAAQGTKAGRVLTFALAHAADYRVVKREPRGEEGAVVTLATPSREIALRSPLPGEAAAIDLAAALAAVESASGITLSIDRLEAALATVRLQGRASLRRLAGDVLLLDDTYNANPQSMRASLATLAEIAGPRRRVAVLGEMKELGPLAEAEHAALGDAIADAGVALVIGCGGLVSLALDRAASRGVEVIRAASTDEAAREAAEKARPGDAILVKASRSVGAERVVAALDKASESLPSATKSASSGAA